MRTIIDAHVHITPAEALGRENRRFGTRNLPYGYLQLGDGGFQTMPCFIRDSQFTAETLVHMMDVYGVERAVIQQSLMAEVNEAIAAAVQRWPDRLAGAMVLEPVPGWEQQMDRLYAAGLHSIKFEMRAYTNQACYPNASYDDDEMMAFFAAAAQRGMTVTIDPAPVDFPIYDPRALETAVSAFPNLRFVLCHLAYPRPIDTPERRARWERMLSIAKRPNCWLDVSAMPDFFDAEGWPYPTALALAAHARDICGADKLIWGSDITGTLVRATYPQMIAMYERAPFSEAELEQLFSRNAQEAYAL